MADPTFNQQMVTKLQGLILANPAASSINVDGTQTTLVDLQARLAFFERRLAREQGVISRFNNPVNLGGFAP